MRVPERAAQIWSLLVFATKNRQTLTYDVLARLIGVPRPALGQLLEPIQSYCLLKDLPALTAIVVSDSTGLPGSGFTAAEDIPAMHALVFARDWLGQSAPKPEEFEAAVAQRPSNAVRPAGSSDE